MRPVPPASSGDQPARRPVSARPPLVRHPLRVVIVVVGMLAVLNLGLLLGRSSDTSEPGEETLPSAVERVSPSPGSTVGRRPEVSVDLRAGLTGVLVIDGLRFPEDQLAIDPSLGTIVFRPGADTEISEFEPGEHTVTVLYWRATEDEPPDPDSTGWRFRSSA